MKEMILIECELKVTKIPSVNQMYLTRRNGGRYLNPLVGEYIEEVQSQLPDKLEGIEKDLEYFKFKVIFKFRRNFWGRDIDNMLKATIDAIFKYYDLNDAWIKHIVVEKEELEGDDELVNFKLIKVFYEQT